MRLTLDCRHRYSSGFELEARATIEARVTALFGPSGSGKTTLLSLIAGLLRPTIGRIALDDTVLDDTAQRVHLAPAQRRVALVAQEPLLFPHLTVAGNLQYGARRRAAAEGAKIELAAVVEVLELGDLLARRPHELSGGQAQRVALGRALLSRPRLLLLDEPVSALDEPLRDRVLAYLERVVATWQLPIIMASHAEAEVRRLANAIIVLDRGRVVSCETLDPSTL